MVLLSFKLGSDLFERFLDDAKLFIGGQPHLLGLKHGHAIRSRQRNVPTAINEHVVDEEFEVVETVNVVGVANPAQLQKSSLKIV